MQKLWRADHVYQNEVRKEYAGQSYICKFQEKPGRKDRIVLPSGEVIACDANVGVEDLMALVMYHTSPPVR